MELVATNGKIQKRVLWFSVTSNGVYSGYCWKNRDAHISYHFDGNVFTNWFDGKTKKTVTFPPLKELDSFRQLYSTVFSGILKQMHECPSYNMKKLDALVTVDTRAYTKGIGINFYIIPQNRADLLSGVTNIPPKTEAHFFFNCNPWIGFVLYGDVYEKEQTIEK